MKSEQKLITARNLLRYIMTEMQEEFDIHCTSDYEFYKHVVNEGLKIKLIKERYPGIYTMTDFEKQSRPRHKGKTPT